MKDLRERAEKIADQFYADILKSQDWREYWAKSIESFAREIRVEALEEAEHIARLRVRCQTNYDMCREAQIIADFISELKDTAALAASGDDK